MTLLTELLLYLQRLFQCNMVKLLSTTVTTITHIIKWVQFALQILGLLKKTVQKEDGDNLEKEEKKKDCD